MAQQYKLACLQQSVTALSYDAKMHRTVSYEHADQPGGVYNNTVPLKRHIVS